MSGALVALYSPRPQSGKSTVARVLEGMGFRVVKFATPLKDMTRGLLRSMGFDHDTVERMVEGGLKEEIIPGLDTVTPRHIMQTLGTKWGREVIDKDIWIKIAIAKAQDLLIKGERVVIDDLRFPNEYEAVRRAGGVVVRIYRPSAGPVERTSHEGMLEDLEFDWQVTNDADLETLQAVARAIGRSAGR